MLRKPDSISGISKCYIASVKPTEAANGCVL